MQSGQVSKRMFTTYCCAWLKACNRPKETKYYGKTHYSYLLCTRWFIDVLSATGVTYLEWDDAINQQQDPRYEGPKWFTLLCCGQLQNFGFWNADTGLDTSSPHKLSWSWSAKEISLTSTRWLALCREVHLIFREVHLILQSPDQYGYITTTCLSLIAKL